MAKSKSKKTHVASIILRTPLGYPLVKKPDEQVPRFWKLPGGTGEVGETPPKTVIRETKEETGLDISGIELALVSKTRTENRRYFIFQGTTDDVRGLKRPTADEEQIRFFRSEELRNLPTFFRHHKKELLKKNII